MNIPVYTRAPVAVWQQGDRSIASFGGVENIDPAVVASFGAEWQAFHQFDAAELQKIGDDYFDILPPGLLPPDCTVLDVGCGTGRWSKYLLEHRQVGHIDAIDPSEAIGVAARFLGDYPQVRFSQCNADGLPFADDVFDLVMSVGVLHHVPDTEQAIRACAHKVKPGGYLYLYLYYNLDNRGPVFRMLFHGGNLLRYVISKLPAVPKKVVCELLAVLIYLPFILLGRALRGLGLTRLAGALPLAYYQDTSFYIARNDALDRFGTRLERRFSRKDIQAMLENAGLQNIHFSEKAPFWHVLAQKPLT